jgi:hypothetical protein
MNNLAACVVCGTAIRAGIKDWCSDSCYRALHGLDHAPLDAIDTLELAELLDFTADALSWREARVIYPDLQAHLRRWARRLKPRPRETAAH